MKQFHILGLIFAIAVIGLVGLGSPNHALAQQIALAGTTSPQTGDFVPSDPSSDITFAEFPGQLDNSDDTPGPYPGSIVDLSFAGPPGNGASANSGKKAKSNPQFDGGFEGLNIYQQRYSRGGNQFSAEPPDQGMCAGNGFVLEAVNGVLNIFNTSGQSVLPDNTATNIVAGFCAECEPCHRPEFVLRLRGSDQPQDWRSWARVKRPELPLRRGYAALVCCSADLGHSSKRIIHRN